MKIFIHFLFFVLLISACEEEVSILTLEADTAVIEGFIYADQGIDSIRITNSISYASDGTLVPIDGLNITLENEEEVFSLVSIGNGYYSQLKHIVQQDQTYSISFDYNGQQVSASTYVHPQKQIFLSQSIVELEKIEFTAGPPMGGPPGVGMNANQIIVDITWENSELDYYFTIIETVETDPEYVNERFEIFAESDDRPQRLFRSEPERTNVYSINSNRELQFFGDYNITVFRLNPEYAALYESIGTSTISLQEPPSNVINGLGIFTAVTPHYASLSVIEI